MASLAVRVKWYGISSEFIINRRLHGHLKPVQIYLWVLKNILFRFRISVHPPEGLGGGVWALYMLLSSMFKLLSVSVTILTLTLCYCTISFVQSPRFSITSKKASAAIGALRRIKPFVPLRTLVTLYRSLIKPYFENCSPLWDTCGKQLKDKLQKIQNRARGVITGSSWC